MTPNEYAVWTDQVAQYPITSEAPYLALGIGDEWGEFISARSDSDVLKEAGDFFWYAARYCVKVLRVSFQEAVDASRELSNVQFFRSGHFVGTILGIEKKRIRDGSEWDELKRYDKDRAAFFALTCLIHLVEHSLHAHKWSLTVALMNNREKLSGRLEAGTIKGDGDNR